MSTTTPADLFELHRTDHPVPDEERAKLLEHPRFGTVFTDHMARVSWTADGGWANRRVEPYAPLVLEATRKRPDQNSIEAQAAAIRHFEAMLASEGVQIVKLWFHLSAQAQKARAERLLASPETSWQVSPIDLKVYKKYDRICNAGQVVLNLTDSGHAPWVVIPSADEDMRAARTAAGSTGRISLMMQEAWDPPKLTRSSPAFTVPPLWLIEMPWALRSQSRHGPDSVISHDSRGRTSRTRWVSSMRSQPIGST